MIKKAVIVAAGLSSRLYPLTLNEPKGLLKVGKLGLLERSINILKKSGITDIAIVVGFKQKKIIESLDKGLTYIKNPFFAQCNNMGSLWFAKDFVKNEPFIYLHGDIIYNEEIFIKSLGHFNNNFNDMELLVDFGETDEEAMKVKVSDSNYLIESSKQISSADSKGEWTGIAFIRSSKEVFNCIEDVIFNDGLNYYDTFGFSKMASSGSKIYCYDTNNAPWVEIDFIDDYKKAKEMFQ